MSGTSSWSSKASVAEHFAKKRYNGAVFVCDNGALLSTSISHLSGFGMEEAEVLVLKDVRFKVIDITIKTLKTDIGNIEIPFVSTEEIL
jgi:hypothetical protein